MESTAVLSEPLIGQDVSSVGVADDSSVDAAIEDSRTEIERRGRMLTGNGEGLSETEFWAYARLASDIGYRRMKEIGNEILLHGGTFPQLRIESVRKYNRGFALEVSEDRTHRRFTVPCASPLRQYAGAPIQRLDDFNEYANAPVALDVRRNGRMYEAVMIGKTNQVLGDGPQAVRLDLIR